MWSVCRVCLSGEKVHILKCLCAEPLKKTMVLVEDDGTAYVLGERIAHVTGKKVLR